MCSLNMRKRTQAREFALQVLYQVDITPPEAGVYQVFAQSSSLNFTFNEQPILTFRAVKP